MAKHYKNNKRQKDIAKQKKREEKQKRKLERVSESAETGFELKEIPTRGESIIASKAFDIGNIVMVGVVEAVLNEKHHHASQIATNAYMHYKGLINKVNHSCDPNCGVKRNENGGHDYVAIKIIDVDDEITIDFAMKNYSTEDLPNECTCSSEKCRGRVLGWKDLPIEKKKQYEGLVVDYVLELAGKESS